MGAKLELWTGNLDGKINEPYVSPERWNTELKCAGFTGTEASAFDAIQPFQGNLTIISRLPTTKPSPPRKISLLRGQHQETSSIAEVRKHFLKAGIEVDSCTLQESPPLGQDVISLLEIDTPFFENISEKDYLAFQTMVANLKDNYCLWVTKPGSLKCQEPGFGMVLGVARTLRLEQTVPFATLEIEEMDDLARSAILEVYLKLHRHQPVSDALNQDFEFALQNGVVNTGRFHRIDVEQELADLSADSPEATLRIGKKGLLSTLAWVQTGEQKKLQEHEILIHVKCTALNFKVMDQLALGRDPPPY
jgi:hypothetical protein